MSLQDLYREESHESPEAPDDLQAASRWLAGKLHALQHLTFRAAVEFKIAARIHRLSYEQQALGHPMKALEYRLSELRCLLDSRDPVAVHKLYPELDSSPLWSSLSATDVEFLRDSCSALSTQVGELLQEWDNFWRPLRAGLPNDPGWIQVLSEETLHKALALFPGLGDLHWVAFRRSFAQGELEASELALRFASELDPDNSLYAAMLMPVALQRQSPKQARAVCEAVYQEWKGRSSLVHFVYGLALLVQVREEEEAENSLRAAQASMVESQHIKPEELQPVQKAAARAFIDYCRWKLNERGARPPLDAYLYPAGFFRIPSPDSENFRTEMYSVALAS